EQVKSFVQSTIDKLHQHGSVQLPSIGRLYMDELKFIQFSPAPEPMPLADAFGLSVLSMTPVMRMREWTEIASAPAEKELAEVIAHPATVRQNQRAWPYWAAASFAAVFLAGTIWINGANGSIQNTIKAGFNPLSLIESPSVQSTVVSAENEPAHYTS